MIERMAHLLLLVNQEDDAVKLLQYFFSQAKECLKLSSIGLYSLFNEEWYFSGEMNSGLSKQMKQACLSLSSVLLQGQEDMMIEIVFEGQAAKGIFIKLYVQGSLIGVVALCVPLEFRALAAQKHEIALFVHYAAIILSRMIDRIQLKDQHHAIIRGLVMIIESLDPYLRNHSKNVANYSLILSKELKLSSKETEAIYYAALFHDLGKVGIPVDILTKTGTLTAEEFEVVKLHPEKGACILEQFGVFDEIVPMVKHHHEMWQGGGYPYGLSGKDIPLGARVISVVDAYDALTTNRSYRAAQHETSAIDVILANTPTQFDPLVVNAFIRIMKELT